MPSNIFKIVALFLVVQIQAQNQKKIDSLMHLLQKRAKNTVVDTVQINLWLQLCKEHNVVNPKVQLSYANQAFLASKKIKYQKGIGLASNYRTRANNDLGNYDEALKHTSTSVAVFTQLKDYKNLGDAYFGFAQSYIFKTNFPQSVFYLNKAIHFHEKAKDYVGWARDYNNLGLLYLKQGKNDTGLNCFTKIIATLSKHQSEEVNRYKNLVQSNIAYVYQIKGKHEKAIAMFKGCLSKDSIANRTAGVAFNAIKIGYGYLMIKKYPLALKYLNQSEKLFIDMDNTSALGDNYRYLGMVYLAKGEKLKAEQYTIKGLELSKSIGELEAMKLGYEQLTLVYKALKKYPQALDSQIWFKKISDSIMNTEINNKVTQIQLTYEFDKKQELFKQQQAKKTKVLEDEAQKQKLFSVIAFLGLLLIGGVAIVMYRNNKRIEKQKEIIENQNDTIQKSLTEKETLLREIHHRVKNNLQIISSLLNIQAEDIDDEKVLSSINDGQRRVQAMSLIHQNLYQSDLINNVNIDKYIADLVSYLEEMYESTSKNIDITIETQKLEFDIDTAIPLGLIINELVSNAFKYAFVNQDSGTIGIEIKAINADVFELNVSDNGIGLPQGFDLVKLKSLGLSLVTMLAEQLDGEVKIVQNPQFLQFCVSFKSLK